jgi:hypothetical protein
LATSTIVTVDRVSVMYVAGQRGRSIAEQAPEAFKTLEAALPSLKGRKFYGVVLGDEYRACVGIDPADDAGSLPYPTWTISGGRYVRRKIENWEDNLRLIGAVVEELRRRPDFDPTRPCVEHYRSRKELLVMVPVQ